MCKIDMICFVIWFCTSYFIFVPYVIWKDGQLSWTIEKFSSLEQRVDKRRIISVDRFGMLYNSAPCNIKYRIWYQAIEDIRDFEVPSVPNNRHDLHFIVHIKGQFRANLSRRRKIMMQSVRLAEYSYKRPIPYEHKERRGTWISTMQTEKY